MGPGDARTVARPSRERLSRRPTDSHLEDHVAGDDASDAPGPRTAAAVVDVFVYVVVLNLFVEYLPG